MRDDKVEESRFAQVEVVGLRLLQHAHKTLRSLRGISSLSSLCSGQHPLENVQHHAGATYQHL